MVLGIRVRHDFEPRVLKNIAAIFSSCAVVRLAVRCNLWHSLMFLLLLALFASWPTSLLRFPGRPFIEIIVVS
jgi:NADH:ubiquinone oxidoreductase subunit 6 (subunit J)